MRLDQFFYMPPAFLSDRILAALYASCQGSWHRRCGEIVQEYHRRQSGHQAKRSAHENKTYVTASGRALYTIIFLRTRRELEQRGIIQRILETLERDGEVIVRNEAGEELVIQRTGDGCYHWRNGGSEGWGCEEHQLVDRIVIHYVLPRLP